ncbi:MAG: phosphopantothenoylcysteine decarboxylase [Candidatus Omnitrophica bacterium]|nr:phosphopantothenoylcysteine decarboxylase [Candidatus Omnitrophota bacterium]
MQILITAGSTWTRIDQVRILTNRFSGKTGLYLANKLAEKGHQLTLIINPHSVGKIDNLKTFSFYYFDEFKNRLEMILKNNKFDAIIHMAAVSDYLPKVSRQGKIASGKKDLNISLVPAPKVIKQIRKLAKKAILIQFKLEVKKERIIEKAYLSMKKNGSDYVVANALEELKSGYKAVLIDRQKKIIDIASKNDLVCAIDKILA